MSITTRVGKIALCAVLAAGLAACKKEDKKAGEGKASGSGSASASGSDKASGSGQASGSAEDKSGGNAMAAIKGAIAKRDGDAPTAGGSGLGGMGAALGGLFGGGGAAASADAKMAKPMDPNDVPKDTPDDMQHPVDPGPPTAMPNIKMPPAGAKGGDCAAVGDRIVAMVETMYSDPEALLAMSGTDMSAMDEATKKMMLEQMASMMEQVKAQMKETRAQMVSMCEAQNWPQELKDCILTGDSLESLQKCEQYVTDEMKAGGGMGEEPPEPPAPAAPAPAWSGASDCPAVGERVMQLAMASAGDVPDEYKAEMESAMKEAIGQVTEACTTGAWSDEQRGCFLKAATIQDAETCFTAVGGGGM